MKRADRQPAVNFVPHRGRYLVKQDEASEFFNGTTLVKAQVTQEAPQSGVIMAVGPEQILQTGERVPLLYGVGDRLHFKRFVGSPVQLDAGEGLEIFLVLKEEDVLGVVKPR
jgi:co-chaperonin GroES (HSP10)